MNLIIMNKIGFCYGVDRSISITKNTKKLYPKPWILLGPLVHNDIVNNELIDEGFIMLDNLDLIKNYQNVTFISTAHGISPKTKLEIEQNNNILIETTCPIVLNNNRKIIKYYNDGFDIVYIGKHNHQESNAILDYIHLVENTCDIIKLNITNPKIVLTNQTTMSVTDIKKCEQKILEKYPHTIIDTIICPATKERQVELLNNLKKFHSPLDKWLIIGDKLSNNTRKLMELAMEYGLNYNFVQNVDDIKTVDFSNIVNLLITSGTSTPNKVIDEIIEYIKENIQ